MKKVYSTSDLQKIHILRSVLEEQGIACTVQGEPLLTLAWEAPLTEGLLELWVHDDDRFEEARALLAARLGGTEPGRDP